MLEHENRFAWSDEKWADKLTKKRVFVFLIAIIGLLILIEIHAINKPAEERSTQDSDVWYEMLIGDVKDFGHDIANGNFVIVSKIVNGEPVEPFHTENASNENTPDVDDPSNEIYTAQSTFTADWTDGRGSVDIEYDFDSNGVADYVDHVEYNGLTPGKRYTIHGRIVPKSSTEGDVYTEGVVYEVLVDENGNQVCDSEAVVAFSTKNNRMNQTVCVVVFAVVFGVLFGIIVYFYQKRIVSDSDDDAISADTVELPFY